MRLHRPQQPRVRRGANEGGRVRRPLHRVLEFTGATLREFLRIRQRRRDVLPDQVVPDTRRREELEVGVGLDRLNQRRSELHEARKTTKGKQ
jgi:hypothetical protein